MVYQNWRGAKISRILDHEDYEIKLRGIPLIVRQGVFTLDQNITYSSSMVLDYLETYDLKGKSVLDVGSGSGILSIYCAKRGADVTAADIDEKAVKNTMENVEKNDVGLKVMQSDLFENVKGRFDLIVGNLPISEFSWFMKSSPLETMKKFLINSRNHIKKEGKVIFTWLTRSTLFELKDFLAKEKFNYRQITKKVRGKEWHLFEINL